MAALSQAEKNLRAATKDALRIQERFVAEPVFARTGKGHLKSEGVGKLKEIKAKLSKRTLRKAG
jgi:hypothetical protein